MKNDFIKELYKKSLENKSCGVLHTRSKGSSLLLQKLHKTNFYFYQQQSSIL